MNKKGLTIIELIITIALVSVIMLFLYKLLATISFESDSEYLDITDRTTRSEIIRTIEDAIIEYNTEESHTKKILIPGFSSNTIYLCHEDVAAGSCNASKAYFTIQLKENTVSGKSRINELIFSSVDGFKESWVLKKGTFQAINNSSCTNPSIPGSEIKILKCHIPVYTKNINNKVVTYNSREINNNNILDDIEITITEFNISQAPVPEEEGGGGAIPAAKTCNDYNLDDYTWNDIIAMYQERISGTYSSDERKEVMKCITDNASRGLENLRKTVIINGTQYHARIINATPCNGNLLTNSSCGLIFKFTDPYKENFRLSNSKSTIGYTSTLAYSELNNITNATGITGGSDPLNPIDTTIAYNVAGNLYTKFNMGGPTTVKYYLASPVEIANKCTITIFSTSNTFCNMGTFCSTNPTSPFCTKTVTELYDNTIANETFGWFRDFYKSTSFYYNEGSSYSTAEVTTNHKLYPIFRLAN